MVIEKLNNEFSVCKLKELNYKDMPDSFCFFAKTDRELSLVCRSADVPDYAEEREDGWKGFRVQGTLDFSLVGILSEISSLLAENGISIFAVSTFDTDYIFTKAESFEAALSILEEAGYQTDSAEQSD